MHQLNNCLKFSPNFGSYVLDSNEICILIRTVTEGHKNRYVFEANWVFFNQNYQKLIYMFYFTDIQLIRHCFSYTPM